jgi:hypothetical protein
MRRGDKTLKNIKAYLDINYSIIFASFCSTCIIIILFSFLMSVCGGHQGWKVVGALQHGKRIHYDFTLSQTAKDGVDFQTKTFNQEYTVC